MGFDNLNKYYILKILTKLVTNCHLLLISYLQTFLDLNRRGYKWNIILCIFFCNSNFFNPLEKYFLIKYLVILADAQLRATFLGVLCAFLPWALAALLRSSSAARLPVARCRLTPLALNSSSSSLLALFCTLQCSKYGGCRIGNQQPARLHSHASCTRYFPLSPLPSPPPPSLAKRGAYE